MATRLLVLAGGRSAERDVSCISAANILRHADQSRHRLLLAHIDPRGRWLLEREPMAFARHPRPDRYPFRGPELAIAPGRSPWLRAGSRPVPVDAVFPALHGPMGEDGTVQGLLELVGAPYVGCDVLGSAVGMDKEFTKRLAEKAGLPVLPWGALDDPGLASGLVWRLGYPVFVKPARLGSSVGVSKARRPSELAAAVREAFRYDTKIVVEKGVEAREIECAVLGTPGEARASVCGEVRTDESRHAFFSYAAKYLDPQGAEMLVPAAISKKASDLVRALSLRAFAALGCYGMARADFLMDVKTGRLWFNEVNTIPGFTPMSFYPTLWKASGLPFPRLIDRLVALAVARRRTRARLKIKP